MDLINGFNRTSLGFSLDPPTWSGQARGSLHDRLWVQVEKRQDLGKKDVQDSSQVRHLIAHNKGKEPIILDNVDTLADNELSLGSLLDLL